MTSTEEKDNNKLTKMTIKLETTSVGSSGITSYKLEVNLAQPSTSLFSLILLFEFIGATSHRMLEFLGIF